MATKQLDSRHTHSGYSSKEPHAAGDTVSTDDTVTQQFEELTAIHDPVPSTTESRFYGGEYSPAHQLEINVQRALLDLEGVTFSSLRVHRLADGICLTGTVRCTQDVTDSVSKIAGEVAEVDRVLNRLVLQKESEARTVAESRS